MQTIGQLHCNYSRTTLIRIALTPWSTLGCLDYRLCSDYQNTEPGDQDTTSVIQTFCAHVALYSTLYCSVHTCKQEEELLYIYYVDTTNYVCNTIHYTVQTWPRNSKHGLGSPGTIQIIKGSQ